MTDPRTVRCPCCDGTGRAGTEAGGRGPSKEALLRAELVRVWDVAGSLERFAASAYETAGAAIAGLVADLEDARNGIAERDRRIADLRSDPLLFFKPAHPTFQARFRQAACSASHNSL